MLLKYVKYWRETQRTMISEHDDIDTVQQTSLHQPVHQYSYHAVHITDVSVHLDSHINHGTVHSLYI